MHAQSLDTRQAWREERARWIGISHMPGCLCSSLCLGGLQLVSDYTAKLPLTPPGMFMLTADGNVRRSWGVMGSVQRLHAWHGGYCPALPDPGCVYFELQCMEQDGRQGAAMMVGDS